MKVGIETAGCPVAALLDFDNFTKGSSREAINRLRADHRIAWEADKRA